MNRKPVTKMLGNLLIRDALYKKYWANEVTFNYGRTGECRIDFMTFMPINQSTSGIEKGSFTAYEIKSCLADFRSKNGHNLIMDKNYYVMPMELYKKVVNELPYNVGVYCPIPRGRNKHDEFEKPTKTEELTYDACELICIKSSHPKERNISNSVALFCMLRSGYNVNNYADLAAGEGNQQGHQEVLQSAT